MLTLMTLFAAFVRWVSRSSGRYDRNVRWVCLCSLHHGPLADGDGIHLFFGQTAACPVCESPSHVVTEEFWRVSMKEWKETKNKNKKNPRS